MRSLLAPLEIGPTLRSLARRRAAFSLVVLEVSCGFAIVVVSLTFIRLFTREALRSSGVDEANVLQVRVEPRKPLHDVDPSATIERDLATLRRLPGALEAAAVESELLFRNFGYASVRRGAVATHAWTIRGQGDLLGALGIVPARGRAPLASERAADPRPVAITRALADGLFGGADPLGQEVLLEASGIRAVVVGIVEGVHIPGVAAPGGKDDVFMPDTLAPFATTRYLVRVRPEALEPVRRALPGALAASGLDRAVKLETLQESSIVSHRVLHAVNAVVGLVIFQILVVVVLGTLGLTAFLAAERSKQIGIRRALGASRRAILGHFLLENVLYTTVGLLLGVPFTEGLFHLAQHSTPDLVPEPQLYFVCLPLFWLSGLVGTLGPALQASRIPPSIASRGG